MIANLVFLVLAGGLPYYLLLERRRGMHPKYIFALSALLLLGAVVLSLELPNTHAPMMVLIAFVNAIFTLYRAAKTTNFYKLGYYLIFLNAPFFILFEEQGAIYSVSMLVSLTGIFLIGRFYEKHYGSANYHYITGVTLATPSIATLLTLYLVALALYPPLPNALFFLSHILNAEPNLLWYAVVITLFVGNFVLAMRVMTKTLFGQPNPNIHYVHLSSGETMPHVAVLIALLALSIIGFQEVIL